MLELDNVELEFTEALAAVSEKAIERKTARGLRSIIEEALIDICMMFLHQKT